jgi:hypothetical protein
LQNKYGRTSSCLEATLAKVLTDRRCVELEELVSFISFFNTLYYREAPQSKLLIKEFEALSKTNNKMSV